METANRAIFYLFVLALILIAVVYFIGVRTDLGALTNAINSLGLTFSGRNQKGQFAQYPTTPKSGGGTGRGPKK